jgi:hypothetical protein
MLFSSITAKYPFWTASHGWDFGLFRDFECSTVFAVTQLLKINPKTPFHLQKSDAAIDKSTKFE